MTPAGIHQMSFSPHTGPAQNSSLLYYSWESAVFAETTRWDLRSYFLEVNICPRSSSKPANTPTFPQCVSARDRINDVFELESNHLKVGLSLCSSHFQLGNSWLSYQATILPIEKSTFLTTKYTFMFPGSFVAIPSNKRHKRYILTSSIMVWDKQKQQAR